MSDDTTHNAVAAMVQALRPPQPVRVRYPDGSIQQVIPTVLKRTLVETWEGGQLISCTIQTEPDLVASLPGFVVMSAEPDADGVRHSLFTPPRD